MVVVAKLVCWVLP